MNSNDYVRLSLELHLFFDRIMKEHSLFLETAVMEKDKELNQIANNFKKVFENTLEKIVSLADGNVSQKFLASNEIVTNNTLEAEKQTSNLSGVNINTNITMKEANLRSGNVNKSQELVNAISMLNRQTLPMIQNLINFKNNILKQVLSCKLYTTNYPLLITHIMNEAKMYHQLLTRIEKREPLTKNYIYEQELFWNNIMKEHAEFIRGLLDPTEKDLITASDNYAKNYEAIINKYSKNPAYLTNASLNETISFQKFKTAGTEGIINCKIKSIIIPLLADHVLREANHFIRILKESSIKN